MGIGARDRGRSRKFIGISEIKWNRAEGIMASERYADESGWESREPKTNAVSKGLTLTSRKNLNIDVV